MNQIKFIFLFLVLLFVSEQVEPETRGGNWSNVPIFSQMPLEVKLGTYDRTMAPDALAVILWNDGNSNRLDAIRIPPPYDGSGVSSTALEDTATLFALGDICTTSNSVVVPYIKNFNLEVARFDGASWSMTTIADTNFNNFDNADCMQTSNGLYLAAHDLTDSETELFHSSNGGQTYTFYGRYNNVSGPFDGASREPLSSTLSGRYIMGLNQTPTGMMRATRIDTNSTPPVIAHTNIRQLPAPAGFTFVRESAARTANNIYYVTYNADGNARTGEIPLNNPSAFTERLLSSVNNNGSQFSFQGSTLVHVEGEVSENNALWGDYFIYDPAKNSPAIVDSSFPLADVGGPVDGCRVDTNDSLTQLFFVGSRVGTVGTDLYVKDLPSASIFTDGFESGDTSVWSQCE